MSEEQIRNSRIEMEFVNPAYELVDEAIDYTIKKYNYKEYDVVKLVIMLYKENYKYLSNDNNNREEFVLLDEYFKKEYNHNVITFIMLKTIINLKGTNEYNIIMKEIAEIEKILRTNGGEESENLFLLSSLIDNKKYDNIMYLIEKNISIKYAVAIAYDKIKIDNKF